MRWRVAFSSACSALALVAAGCGGSAAETPPADQPALPAQLGAQLASQTDAVAQALEAGDAEEARRRAEALRGAVVAAINGGRVPAPLQEPLLAAVQQLIDSIPEPEPEPPAEEEPTDEGGEDEKDEGKGKGKDKDKDKDEDEDEDGEDGDEDASATVRTDATETVTGDDEDDEG